MRIADLAREHQRIGIDSNVVIYALEGSGRESTTAGALFDLMAAGACGGVLSILGLIEVLVGPARHVGDALVQRYADELMELDGLAITGIDREAAVEAAHVRAAGTPLADAIHLASARRFGASAFVTNDRRVKPVQGLEVIALADVLA
ncbi:MAG: type II toxin-antitoxin system VapC family toxin [Candidatus Limnocylindria bacterium]